MRRTWALVPVLALLALLIGAPPARAQAAESIQRYQSQITIEPSGDLRIVEQIVYDFGGNSKHGITRQIPTRFHFNARYDRLEPVSDVHVTTSPGTPAQTKVSTAGSTTNIRIGDPSRTITGVHTYNISYRVQGALNAFPDHDELFWNAIGDEWFVFINNAGATVAAPAAITKVACFAGSNGSRLSCDHALVDGSTATFAQGELSFQSGLTVVVGLPKGAVHVGPPILKERWSFSRAFSVTGATAGGAAALAVVLIGAIVALVWRGGRDRRFVGSAVDVAFGSDSGRDEPVPLGSGRSVPVEFEPPDKLRPGELGTLVDAAANPLDVTATIVDLAVRGYLRIEEIPKEGWRGKADWNLVQTRKPDDKLLKYEDTLLDGIFTGGRADVKLSELRNTFATKLHKVEDELYDDAMDRGWFVRRPNRVRAFWTAMGILASIVGIAALVVLAALTHVALLGIPLALAGLLLLAVAHWMPARTAKGYGVLQRTRGFKRFIDESEKERARFAERKNLFSEYLPYAIVFHATDKWARAFAGLDGQLPDTGGWYVSPNLFTLAAFSSAMDGFTTTTAGTIASTPGTSGSSGFSGGFSGGGGGGGGGGSW
ncbi:MAG TPA: DUF2207 domain-containing protein [Acidimicrobiales bacterium]|jgi:uncharacterized protein (TIGR04222 family)|nr:DUF2207 domain-containing protein [Acidimicrobiales bacterium]